ncbi:MAG: hypothetical protein HKN78_02815 [Sphingomonadaceae bacterium]|nr:hypothetical protein [Sphingomonadaceae bacterium]
MSEADLLYHFILVREQLDATIAQTVGLTLALFVGIFYFLHRAGWRLKAALFVMYLLGWFTFVTSGALASEQLIGILGDLAGRVEAGEASIAARRVVASMSGTTNMFWVITVNIANYVLLAAVIGFLFFWKPPGEGGAGNEAEDG